MSEDVKPGYRRCEECRRLVKLNRSGRLPRPRAGLVYGLNASQWRVAEAIYKGWQQKQIASELGIEVRTVKCHTTAINKRWGTCNSRQILLRVAEIKRNESRQTDEPKAI